MRSVAVVLTVLLSACSTAPSEQAKRVQEADLALVENCEFIGSVNGNSGFGGPGGSNIGMERSKNQARERAADKGATHVVWIAVSGGYSSSASGNAYKCK